jgi:hypothetical protein
MNPRGFTWIRLAVAFVIFANETAHAFEDLQKVKVEASIFACKSADDWVKGYELVSADDRDAADKFFDKVLPNKKCRWFKSGEILILEKTGSGQRFAVLRKVGEVDSYITSTLSTKNLMPIQP